MQQQTTRTSKIVSLSVSPSLLKDAEKWAKKEGRTKSGLFTEALRFYIQEREWKDLQRTFSRQAQKKGITESDIPRIIEEYRNER